MLATGPLQAAKVGRVRPVAFSTGFSRPASPSVAISRAVDREADGLADGQLVSRPLVQVRHRGVGAAGGLPEVVVGRVLVDEVLLQAGDVVTGPVDLPGEQRGERAGVGGVDGEVDLRDLDLRRLPVVGFFFRVKPCGVKVPSMNGPVPTGFGSAKVAGLPALPQIACGTMAVPAIYSRLAYCGGREGDRRRCCLTWSRWRSSGRRG